MPKVILIIGLPGSGKTRLGEKMLDYKKYKNFDFLDDPSINYTTEQISKFVSEKRNLIVADPMLCDEYQRKTAIELFLFNDYKIEFRYFENNQEKCWNNIRHRKDRRKIVSLTFFNYTIPEYIKPIKIWQPKKAIQ